MCSAITIGRLNAAGKLVADLTLERRLLALPTDCELVVIDSGLPRALLSSAYNERRKQCEMAAAKLGVPSLR
jgi:galactokinase